MKKTSMLLAAAVTALAGWVPATSAETRVDERQPAHKDVRVRIRVPVGELHVAAWDNDEISVSGTLGRRAGELDFRSRGGRARIEVEGRGHHRHGSGADLRIQVPRGASLSIESFSTDVQVDGVQGDLEIQSVQGSVAVTGAGAEVEVETVNGSVDVNGAVQRLRIEAVSGAVTVAGVGPDAAVSTVSGRLQVDGGPFRRGRFESVSGSIRVTGGLDTDADVDVETVSGSVKLTLPDDVSARFDVTTFSGSVDNELGPEARRVSRLTPNKELEFTTGSGSARVRIQTLSGSVKLYKR